MRDLNPSSYSSLAHNQAQAASSSPFPDQDPRWWLVSFPYVGPDPCSACMIPSSLLWALFPCRIRFLCSIRILFRALTLLDRCQGQAWIIHLSLTIYRFQIGIHRCWYHPFPLECLYPPELLDPLYLYHLFH
jgi:hypothetical protein